jgi:hypothetical protein
VHQPGSLATTKPTLPCFGFHPFLGSTIEKRRGFLLEIEDKSAFLMVLFPLSLRMACAHRRYVPFTGLLESEVS